MTMDPSMTANTDTVGDVKDKKCSSMTLAISASNANRMLEASRNLNACFRSIQNNELNRDFSNIDHESLISVVKNTKDDLLCLFLDSMLTEINTGVLSQEEMKLSFLVFFDMDKSSKLLSAFEILKKCEAMKDIEAPPDCCDDANKKVIQSVKESTASKDNHDESGSILLSLKRTQMKMLFLSFLTAISTCINFNSVEERKRKKCEITCTKSIKCEESDSPKIHQQIKMAEGETFLQNDENKENDAHPKSDEKKKEWHVKREIEEIAKYATDRVFHDILQKQEGKREIDVTENIEFQEFGEWYNSGGYSLVPWLELLDLAKWDYAGRSAATAEAENKSKKLSQKRKHLVEKDHEEGNTMSTSMEKIHLDRNKGFVSPAIPDMFLQSPTIAPPSEKNVNSPSQVLISFNFSGSRKSQIAITRENLLQLQHIVTITDFSLRSPGQIANVLLRRSKRTRGRVSHSLKGMQSCCDEEMMVLSSHDFGNCIRDLIPSETLRRLSSSEIDSLMNRFTCFFLCYGLMNASYCQKLGTGYVNAKELAVGLSFLCNGNKSAKLASTFELIGDPNFAYLSQSSLFRYIRSYLTMLGSISLLSLSESTTRNTLKSLQSGDKYTINSNLRKIFDTVEYGSRWTLDHFLQNDRKTSEKSNQNEHQHKRKIFFENFASWYTDGGFTISPWLEFLDLRKFMSLLDENDQMRFRNSKAEKQLAPLNPPGASGKIRTFDECFVQSPMPQTKTVSSSSRSQKDILFTFPLANKENLFVLREDAAWVRMIVDNLGLLNLSPHDVWGSLKNYVKKKIAVQRTSTKGAEVDQKSFVTAVVKVLPSKIKRKRPSSSTLSPTPQETLVNFFQSFDLNQIGRVTVNQLMGGLTLLCGGKKSEKLAFAFSLFDFSNHDETKAKKKSKKGHGDDSNATLCGKELFYFFRSFLIVMFSCCKQSLDLSADAVGRYISDTANMVTDEVMKYQWRVRRIERVNFIDFGEWYNEGGFETAPWLELLDLNKWVLLDEQKAEKLIAEAKPMKASNEKSQMKDEVNNSQKNASPKKSPKIDCPPAPPDEEIDQHSDNFFDDIEMDGIGGDIGDMGFLFPDAGGKESEDHLEKSLSLGIAAPSPYRTNFKESENDTKALKFQLFTNESNAFTISINPQRVQLLKHLMIESNFCNITIKTACEKILKGDNGKQISREKFNSAMHGLIDEREKPNKSLIDLFTAIFNAFDFNKLGKADATELACGLTVLCGGRKSDKLEYAFELLDKEKRGLVSRFQMVRYLQSFLLVLLTISSCQIDSTTAEKILKDSEGNNSASSMALARVICGASSWATEEIFKATPNNRKEIKEGTEHINFENFADWYTKGGYNRIAWLELLDLKKWVLSDDS